jgi:hypothetical protein
MYLKIHSLKINNIMKTLKSIVLALSLLVVVGAANATETPVALTKNYAINTYIDAITRGQIAGVNDVLDQNVKFTTTHGKKVLTYNKKDIMDNINFNKGVEMECTTNTSVIETNADYTLVKVDMKFDNSTRSNYVTMVNTTGGWKITNVYSVVK